MMATMAKKKPKPDGQPNPRSKDRHKQPRLTFHLSDSLYGAFKEYVEGLEPKANEASVLRLALERYLTSVGKWPPQDQSTPKEK